jgi:hypothetical protein
MNIFVDQSGLKDLQEILAEEGITFQESPTGSVRELNTGSWPVTQVQANLPEVKIPPEYSQGDVGARAFRLPSGKLIITNLEGNLDRITIPVPSKA